MNKFKWFTHDHDAHDDVALRTAVRRHGHVAGWIWWCTLELMHKHGTGDTLTMPLVDMAASMMVDKRTCKAVYQTLCEVLLITRASYEPGRCTTCTLTIEKFRERQSKLKIKIPSTLRQDSSNTPLEEKRRERETDTPDFVVFWEAYPKKVGKVVSRRAWGRVPSGAIPDIMKALSIHAQSPDWKKDGGKFIPHPATWLNGRRWEDDIPVPTGSNNIYD